MPKRRNPFGDSSGPQIKTHVREQEVNKGICQQTRMQSVYERTHHLLFTGMKELQESHMPVDVNENCLPHSEAAKRDRCHPKQMHLNNSCQLVGCDSGTPMDMEADLNHCHNSVVQHPLTLDAYASIPNASGVGGVNSCEKISPYFGNSFGAGGGDQSLPCSPPSLPSLSSSPHLAPLPDVVSSSSATGDAFSFMRQAQRKRATSNDLPGMHQACSYCRQPVKPQDVARCQFCETTICCACFRQCCGCLLSYCQLCSVVNYDLPAERAFCLNCQTR